MPPRGPARRRAPGSPPSARRGRSGRAARSRPAARRPGRRRATPRPVDRSRGRRGAGGDAAPPARSGSARRAPPPRRARAGRRRRRASRRDGPPRRRAAPRARPDGAAPAPRPPRSRAAAGALATRPQQRPADGRGRGHGRSARGGATAARQASSCSTSSRIRSRIGSLGGRRRAARTADRPRRSHHASRPIPSSTRRRGQQPDERGAWRTAGSTPRIGRRSAGAPAPASCPPPAARRSGAGWRPRPAVCDSATESAWQSGQRSSAGDLRGLLGLGERRGGARAHRPGRAPPARAAPPSRSAGRGASWREPQRGELRVHLRRRQRPDVAGAHDPIGVDEEGLGRPGDAQVDRDPASGVEQVRPAALSVSGQEAARAIRRCPGRGSRPWSGRSACRPRWPAGPGAPRRTAGTSWPRRSRSPACRPAESDEKVVPSSVVPLKAGSGLPISGEGISRGSRPSPVKSSQPSGTRTIGSTSQRSVRRGERRRPSVRLPPPARPRPPAGADRARWRRGRRAPRSRRRPRSTTRAG